MKVGVFNRTVLLMLVILLFSNIVYKAIVSPYNFFGSINLDLKVVTSFVLMYFLGNVLLPKKVKAENITSSVVFILLMATFVYSIYLISNVKFYIETLFMLRNFSMNLFNSSPYFHPSTMLFAWILVLVSSLALKKFTTSLTREYKQVSENMMISYSILFFGLIYILGTNVSSFFESAKIVFMQESSIMHTSYEMKWFLHIKRLLINIIILSIYCGFIFSIENKYIFVFKKKFIFFITTILLIIGAYSFKSFVGYVNFLIFSEQSKALEPLHFFFIPVILGFYFLARYLNSQLITKQDVQKV